MRIGDAAAAAGTTPRALRFYEQRGLLPPPRRTPSGQRDYGEPELARLRTIRDLLALGFTVQDLHECADRLDRLTAGDAPRCAAGGLVDRRLTALDSEIGRLTELRENLAQRAYGET
ncbi:MerR family transcriptional regulator [Streptomyces beijiangensis]|uniref:MerR family transcriptional regulator n=1 Tax=Streptomyces beijiangensis TaxID=163361 RepID=A0A939F6C2_9ACTN|nr:MerR family transcriptional regulator [Streptomyces beijiangensis]MBO0512529.1 MerR family transcriptional regulator [Streptomyces beijiangensis]